MIVLIMLGSVINYLTRSTLAVAAPTVLKDLHITTQQYSWIVGAFQDAIMAQPVCGYALDVLGLKMGFAIFAVAWSLVNMAHCFANSWQAFAWLRGLLGFSEGSANPAGMKATAEWFPASERGLAGGVYNIGASVGSMLAPPLVDQHRGLGWLHACSPTGGLGHLELQLAGSVCDHGQSWRGLGGALAVVLPIARQAPRTFPGGEELQIGRA